MFKGFQYQFTTTPVIVCVYIYALKVIPRTRTFFFQVKYDLDLRATSLGAA
jgi:hypothetical protein